MRGPNIFEVAALTRETADAYSFARYASWAAVIKMLMTRGYNAAEVEAIVRSKWTRWAADASPARYGRVPAKALANFLDGMKPKALKTEIAKLVVGTFPEKFQ